MKSLKMIAVAAGVAAFTLGLVALAGLGDTRAFGLSVILACGGLAFAINWLAFIPAAILRTERFFDLTGSVTYLAVVGLAVIVAAPLGLRSVLVAVCVVVWALRLGIFLFARISADGQDKRLEQIKQEPARFFVTWTVQACWVTLTSACAIMAISTGDSRGLDGFLIAGLIVWAFGFALEVVADAQKRAFRRDPDNAGRFIQTGLWAWSRHPNYFGEILLWFGITIIATPVLSGTQWVVMISPVFVTVLLTRVSGIPLLEKAGMEKWGDDPAYQAYLDRTPVLIPRPPAT